MSKKNNLKALHQENPNNPSQTITGLSISTVEDIFPPAEELPVYEKHCPGFVRELLDITKSEQAHRHALENREQARKEKMSNSSILIAHKGQIFAFALPIAVVGAIVFLLLKGITWQALLPTATLVPFMIYFFKKLSSNR